MDDSREGAMSISPLNSARSYANSEDRRKRSFRNLICDLAERLDADDIKKINFQEDVPHQLRDRPALEVLEHLYKRRTFSEYEVRPLAQLLKDIHHEDLISRVDAFWEEFGRHYSVIESARNCGVRESGEDRRANTFSVSNESSTLAQTKNVPASTAVSTEAHQEHGEPIPPLNNAQEVSQHGMTAHGPQPPCPNQQSYRQPHHSLSFESSTGMHGQFSSNNHESRPHFCCTPTLENSCIHRQDWERKVSQASIPFTLETSSTSSSVCGLHSQQPSSQKVFFPMDQLSQENLLHSSSSCVSAEVSYGKVNPSPNNVDNLTSPKKWYEMSSSVASLPVDQRTDMHGASSVSKPVHVQNQLSHSCRQGGHPMSRSLSQEYYRQSPYVLSKFSRKRHSFVPGSRARSTQQGSCRCSLQFPCVACRASFQPQNVYHLPSLSASYSCSNHHLQCCQGHGHESLPPDYCSEVRASQLTGYSSYACSQLEPPIEHMSGTVSEEIMRNAWSGEPCKDPTTGKNMQQHHHKALPSKTFDYDVRCNYDNNYKVSPPTLVDCEQRVQGLVPGPQEQSRSAESEKERSPKQQTKYESQSLNRRQDITSHPATTSTSFQSLNHSSTSKSSKPTSTYRSRSSSVGNTSGVTASNRTLDLEKTLTSSSNANSPPVESPPTTKSQGLKDYHLAPSGFPTAHTSIRPSISLKTSNMASSTSRTWKLFHSSPKPHLLKPDHLVWPVKRDKLNKYIYKKKAKLLTCKLSVDVISDHSTSTGLRGPFPKISVQLHPYGAEEDLNKSITMKISIDLPKKCQLHSETEIEFQVCARELQNSTASKSPETLLGPTQRRRELITRNFFYIKGFITHEALKNSDCDFVEVIVLAKLCM